MSNRAAIPLACRNPSGQLIIGTGFLGRRNGRTRIYTALHILNQSLQSNLPVWPPEVIVFESPKSGLNVPLIRFEGSRRFGMFSTLGGHDTPDMADMVALDFEPIVDRLLPKVPVCDFAKANSNPEAGGQLFVYGFPERNSQPEWPYKPASFTSGAFLSSDGYVFLAQMKPHPDEGFSGGPVFDSNDRFVGMMIGLNDDDATIIVPAVTLSMLA